jgi:hypothetical protein
MRAAGSVSVWSEAQAKAAKRSAERVHSRDVEGWPTAAAMFGRMAVGQSTWCSLRCRLAILVIVTVCVVASLLGAQRVEDYWEFRPKFFKATYRRPRSADGNWARIALCVANLSRPVSAR